MDSINKIAENTEAIATALSRPDPFWDTQWFAALIGATAALLITSLIDQTAKRNKILRDFYDKIAKNGHGLSLQSIGVSANIIRYGHTATRNGVSTEVPEKTFSERVIIELRKKCKYWTLPPSKIRFMLKKYEKLLSKIPDTKNLKTSDGYIEATEYYQKILDFVYKKTGENIWTAR